MRKLPVLALAALLPLAACNRAPAPAADSTAPSAQADTALGRKIQAAMQKASEKLATENLRVGNNVDAPKAEITPQGDLLIDGKPVPVDAAQRQLLLAHRANLVAVAQAGIAVGLQGADLGVKAATGALKSVLSGHRDEFEQQMKAQGERIAAEAVHICERLPPLLDSQQALAASLPAFRPYATMDASDIDDCRNERQSAWQASGAPGGDAAHVAHADAAAEADAAAKGSADARTGKQ